MICALIVRMYMLHFKIMSINIAKSVIMMDIMVMVAHVALIPAQLHNFGTKGISCYCC